MTLNCNAKLACIAAIVALAAPHAVQAKKPEKIELAADSEMAAVVIKADHWDPAPNMKSAFKLTLSTYDEVAQKLTGKPFGGSELIEAKKKNFVDGYLIALVKPGRWVFQSYSQQDRWALCFNASTLQFEAKAGEVIYLGELDSRFHRAQLSAETMKSGKYIISGSGFADFFDLSSGPRLHPVDETQLQTVRTSLAEHTPKITAPVRAVEYSPAAFGTGSTLWGQRKCGGYFAKGAEGN
ncbi:MAG: hypothetical protein H6918_11540 [Sphingomonadaceae bacterium]|nr:hypothetical protein [Sphingomonadaceae bacterium]